MLLRSGTVTPVRKRPWSETTTNDNLTTAKKLKRKWGRTDDLEKEKEEEFHLRSIFPPEIWLLILDNIPVKTTHSEDNTLQNVCNASPYFRKLLSPKRVQFLYPDVVTILKSSSVAESVGRDLLKCRQVCTSWNSSMLDYYRCHPSRLNLLSSSQKVLLACDNLTTVEFASPTNVITFQSFLRAGLGRFLQKDGNPFPFGIVEFKFIDEDEEFVALGRRAFWEHLVYFINHLLHYFGRHILHCKIVLPGMVQCLPTLHYFYPKVTRWMSNMVNLKTLDISYIRKDHLAETDVYKTLIRPRIAWCPMPTLGQLECLQTRNLPSLLFNELVRSNGHVRKLHVVGVTPEYNFCRRNSFGSRLQEMQVKIVDRIDEGKMGSNGEEMEDNAKQE